MKISIALVLSIVLLNSCSSDENTNFSRRQPLPSGQFVNIIGLHLAFGKPNGDDCFLVQFVGDKDPRVNEQEADDLFKLMMPTCEAFSVKRLELDSHKTANVYTNFIAYHYRQDANGKWARSGNGGVYKSW